MHTIALNEYNYLKMSVQEISSKFTRELPDNNLIKDALFSAIASNNMVLFIGAGCSSLVEYPNWNELLVELENQANKCGKSFKISNDERNDPIIRAQKIKEHIISECRDLSIYYSLIYHLYKPNDKFSDVFHLTLMKLPFAGIITTNYDMVLEKALAEIEPMHGYNNYFCISEAKNRCDLSEFLLSLNDPNHSLRKIAHLHGVYNDPDSIVLCEGEYNEKYGDPNSNELSTLHRRVLYTILATHKLLFLGFSLEDKYLLKLLGIVNADLWRWSSPTHYAIMPICTNNINDVKIKARLLKERYSVEVLFYDNDSGNHQNLRKLIGDIADYNNVIVSPEDLMMKINQKMLGE